MEGYLAELALAVASAAPPGRNGGGMQQLPNTGVKLSMLLFGGLTLLILGGGAFLASRKRR